MKMFDVTDFCETQTTESKEFEAILYGWRHIKSPDSIYIGFHKTKNIYDGYTFSSENEELRNEWSYGNLERVIIAKGSVSEMITLENFALKYAKSKGNEFWKNLYNNSVGGGEGCVKDFSNLSEELKNIAKSFVDGNFVERKVEKDTYALKNYTLIDSIKERIKNEYYIKVCRRVDEIFNLKRYQVRLKQILQEKVDAIADSMIDDPAGSRKRIDPVIVLVLLDGSHLIIDGNHTINAAKQAKWIEVDVIYINITDFDNMDNVTGFSYGMNHNETGKINSYNQPEDCQRAILLKYQHVKTENDNHTLMQTEKFKNTILADLSKYWSTKVIVKNLDSVIRREQTNEAIAEKNFYVYQDSDSDKYREEADDNCTSSIRISSGACYNAGVGAIMNKMGQEGTTEGIIIITHKNVDQYDSWKSSEQKLIDALSFLKEEINVRWRIYDPFNRGEYKEGSCDNPTVK